ncbi:MAG TPA: GrpB family protein, partial [Leptolyngbyaceae cyanobacterium M65_K2018_010]|nr:GrpB family protein [Leptolyngbyaceae cyanobacterium M65_K2018_010]
DYLIAHPAAAQQYSNLKRTLAARYPNDIDRYMDGKDELVKSLENQALAWQASCS